MAENDRTLKLSLLENSHSFISEAAYKAVAALNDPINWRFAILNLVQAVELSLKEMLRRVHPIFIYKNIDSPKMTVDLTAAIARLENKKISGIRLSESEIKRINQASKIRNKITHYEFELNVLTAQTDFSELFVF